MIPALSGDYWPWLTRRRSLPLSARHTRSRRRVPRRPPNAWWKRKTTLSIRWGSANLILWNYHNYLPPKICTSVIFEWNMNPINLNDLNLRKSCQLIYFRLSCFIDESSRWWTYILQSCIILIWFWFKLVTLARILVAMNCLVFDYKLMLLLLSLCQFRMFLFLTKWYKKHT